MPDIAQGWVEQEVRTPVVAGAELHAAVVDRPGIPVLVTAETAAAVPVLGDVGARGGDMLLVLTS